MHIPNGFLTDPICTVSTLAATAALGASFARVRQLDNSRSAGLMAATGAGIFAAQMVNFPIDGGTSGHVLGAAMAAIVLGPWRGMLTMAVVLAAQCFLFGDGGTSALGANILNMAVVGTLVAAGLNAAVTRSVSGSKGQVLGAGVAAFGSVLAAASLCSVELAASGTYGLAEVFAAMIRVHAVIGLSEAIATASLVGALIAIGAEGRSWSRRGLTVASLALAIAVAGLLAPLASSAPDGLERVAQDLNFANLGSENLWAVAPDYAAPGVAWPALAVALAGVAGVALVYLTAYTVGRTATVKVGKR